MKRIRTEPLNRSGVTDISLPPNSRPLSVVLHNSMMRGKVVLSSWLLPDGWEHMETVSHRVAGFVTDQGVPPHIQAGNVIGTILIDGSPHHYFFER